MFVADTALSCAGIGDALSKLKTGVENDKNKRQGNEAEFRDI